MLRSLIPYRWRYRKARSIGVLSVGEVRGVDEDSSRSEHGLELGFGLAVRRVPEGEKWP